MTQSPLVLSLFPGIGLLDRAFEEEGFTIVRGPDPLWGGDIRNFRPPGGVFAGIIGGPPCQRFSGLANINRARYGEESLAPNLIPEFERCVAEEEPCWFVMENVPNAPEPIVEGYVVRSYTVNNRWFGAEQHRERRFSFGTRDGLPLLIETEVFEHPRFETAVTASNGGRRARPVIEEDGKSRGKQRLAIGELPIRRPLSRLCELQGLPPDFLSDAPFGERAKRQIVANGVPLPMGRAIARAVREAIGMRQEAER